MKNLPFIILASLVLIACNGKPAAPSQKTATVTIAPAEDLGTVKYFLNTKFPGKNITDVEVIRRDSVLSFSPMTIMYPECMKNKAEGTFPGKAFDKLSDYFYHLVAVRTSMRTETPRQEDLTGQHQGDWRRIITVKATHADGTVDNIEVVFDSDNATPYLTGQDYDREVSSWDLKINSL
jgi:hypothetical protein